MHERQRLFGVLPNTLFGVFHRASRVEYARLIVEIWEEFYADPLEDHPLARQVTAFIDDQVRQRRSVGLLGVEEAQAAESPGASAYRVLVDAGWLAPYPDAYRTRVDMPEPVQRLVRFLRDLERGSAATLGGAVAAMRSALQGVRDNPEGNALAVRDTAGRAEDFLWRLRGLVAGLRRIEREILEESDPGRTLGRFFASFVSVVIADWHVLKTAHNPYRHRGEVIDLASRLLDDPEALRRLAFAYADQELAPDIGAARMAVRDDLERVRSNLLGLDRLMTRLDGVRRRIERRVAITVAYLDLVGEGRGERLHALLRELGRYAEPGDQVPITTLAPEPGQLAPHTLAVPRAPRTRLDSTPPSRDPPDPRLAAFVEARRAFLERTRVGNAMLAEFVARQCADGEPRRAADICIDSIEDAVATCAIPVLTLRRVNWPGFTVESLPGRAVSAMLDGPDFRLVPGARGKIGAE
jgi:hypothetical protein